MIILPHGLLAGGARVAARFGVTGAVPAGVSREDRIKEIVAGHSIGMIDLSEVEIETLVYDSFTSIGQSEPFEDCMGTGTYHPDCPFTDINGNGVWDEDLGVAGLGYAAPGGNCLYAEPGQAFRGGTRTIRRAHRTTSAPFPS
jgi:hypothetical protein